MKKIIASILLILVLAIVLFLALQGPEETFALSERVRILASKMGYRGSPLQFRSDVHYVEYFVVGLVVILFFKALGWKTWLGALMACVIGLAEETLKIFLPTREFGYVDLIKDFVGIGAAMLIVVIMSKIRRPSYDGEKK